MIQALIGPIASLAGSWMESKVEATKAKGKVAQAKAEAEAELMKHEAGWEKVMAQARTTAGKMKRDNFVYNYNWWFVPPLPAICKGWLCGSRNYA